MANTFRAIQSAPISRLPFASGRHYPGTYLSDSGAYAALAVVDRLLAVPIIIPTTTTFTGMGVVVNTTAVGGLMRAGVYSAVGGLPSSLITETGTIDVASSGSRTSAFASGNLTLEPGAYFMALVSNTTTATIWLQSAPDNQRALGMAAGEITWSGAVYVAHTFGALPATFGAVTYNLNVASPDIRLIVA